MDNGTSKFIIVFTLGLATCLTEFLPANASTPTVSRFKQAHKLMQERHIAEARRLLRSVVQQPDATAPMYCELAASYLDIEGMEDESPECIAAVQGLNEAIRKAPQYGKSYALLATFANLRGHYSDGVAYATKALSVSEPWGEAYRQRSLAYSHMNRFDDAIKDVDSYINSNPGCKTSINYMLRGDLQQAAKQYPAAEASYREALRLATTYLARSFNQLIKCLSIEKKYGEVIAEVSKKLAKDPTNSEMLDLRGQYLVKEKKYKEALADYNNAIAGDQISLYYVHRADLYDVLGQKKLADDDRAKSKKDVQADFTGF